MYIYKKMDTIGNNSQKSGEFKIMYDDKIVSGVTLPGEEQALFVVQILNNFEVDPCHAADVILDMQCAQHISQVYQLPVNSC